VANIFRKFLAEGQIPPWIIGPWAIILIVGPLIASFITGDMPARYAHDTAKWALGLRVLVGGLIPLLWGLALCVFYLLWPGYRIWSLAVLAITLLPVSSVKNSALDFFAGPVTRTTQITGFKDASRMFANWTTIIDPFSGMEFGSYRVRLKVGPELDIQCAPICLDREKRMFLRKKWRQGYESMLFEDCRIVSYDHLGEIVALECAAD
jgi:hypothetical protein